MSHKYDGITGDSLFLLADNRFRNSKAYYEEHKELIKAGVTVPMRQIAAVIGEKLLSVDPIMNTVPVKMVSRVRRDTRFTRDKSLYRENMWIMFMRPKHEWINYPCYWFEITPREYSLGVGLFGSDSSLMEIYRKKLRESPNEFAEAAKLCIDLGANFFSDSYKRGFDGAPEGLEAFYNVKNCGFIKYSDKTDDLASDKILDIINEAFDAFTPMYLFLLSVADENLSKTQI